MSQSSSPLDPAALAAQGAPKKYVRAVSPRLRKLLYFIFALVALLSANASYLASITALEWVQDRTYQNYFYQYMFLAHLVLGLVLVVPFVLFGVFHMLAARNRRNRRAVRIGYILLGASLVVFDQRRTLDADRRL